MKKYKLQVLKQKKAFSLDVNFEITTLKIEQRNFIFMQANYCTASVVGRGWGPVNVFFLFLFVF